MDIPIIKAIPTKYDGVQYRSRLEARWAYFFDQYGVHHAYEPWPLEGENGDNSYLPDFFLCFFTHKEAVIEIKPITPNEDYINRLNALRDRKRSDIFILVGTPSLIQPNGIWMHTFGNEKRITKGFEFKRCKYCGCFGVDDTYMVAKNYEYIHCGFGLYGHYKPNNISDQRAEDNARHIRFDLI